MATMLQEKLSLTAKNMSSVVSSTARKMEG